MTVSAIRSQCTHKSAVLLITFANGLTTSMTLRYFTTSPNQRNTVDTRAFTVMVQLTYANTVDISAGYMTSRRGNTYRRSDKRGTSHVESFSPLLFRTHSSIMKALHVYASGGSDTSARGSVTLLQVQVHSDVLSVEVASSRQWYTCFLPTVGRLLDRKRFTVHATCCVTTELRIEFAGNQ